MTGGGGVGTLAVVHQFAVVDGPVFDEISLLLDDRIFLRQFLGTHDLLRCVWVVAEPAGQILAVEEGVESLWRSGFGGAFGFRFGLHLGLAASLLFSFFLGLGLGNGALAGFFLVPGGLFATGAFALVVQGTFCLGKCAAAASVVEFTAAAAVLT